MNFEYKIKLLLRELKKFYARKAQGDKVWEIIIPGAKNQFHFISVIQSYRSYYFQYINDDICTVEVTEKGEVNFGTILNTNNRDGLASKWDRLIEVALQWVCSAKYEWVMTTPGLYEHMPLCHRAGVTSNAIIRLRPLYSSELSEVLELQRKRVEATDND